jgi:hypothetical protein
MSKAMSVTAGPALAVLPTSAAPSQSSVGRGEAEAPRAAARIVPVDAAPTDRTGSVPAGSAPAGSAPAGSAPAGPPATDPMADAAEQVVSTLARAMRRSPDDFGGLALRLAGILTEGGWSAAALATHLVDIIAGGVMVGGDSPVDSLGWRLDHLPRSSADCPCRSCRSWRSIVPSAPAAPSAPAGPPGPVARNAQSAVVSPPELSAIEQAAAAGAAQARLHRAQAS